MLFRFVFVVPFACLWAVNLSRHVLAAGSLSDHTSPEHSRLCGTWQKSYTAFHKHELSKGDAARIMVAVPHRSGIADRITGLATVFMWALASKRAFQVGNVPGLRPLEDAFESPSINWTRPQDPDWVLEPLLENAALRQFNDSVFPHAFAAVNLIGSRSDEMFDGDLLMHHSVARVILVSTNRGRTVRLFDHPSFTEALEGTGLSADTAFGCFVNYLFKPLSEDFEHLQPQHSLANNQELIKIGIQVRVGDASMHSALALQDFEEFFSCARQIEHFISHHERSVIWVLVSDSQHLRTLAVARYGHKIVTADVAPEHSAKESSVCEADCQVSLDGFRTAAGEWWLLGTCDFYVISADSGFGRTAAFRSLQQQAVYAVQPDVSKQCSQGTFDHYAQLAAQWSGI